MKIITSTVRDLKNIRMTLPIPKSIVCVKFKKNKIKGLYWIRFEYGMSVVLSTRS
jgi:hypothetical protein